MGGLFFQLAICKRRKRKRNQKIKLSSLSMDGTRSPTNKASCRQRNRKAKNSTDDNTGIGNFNDDLLTAILSHMSLKEAARTSVLAHRWKYLWMFAFRALKFDDTDTANGKKMKRKVFKSWVNTILKLHWSRPVDSLIIRFSNVRPLESSVSSSTYGAIDSWISFAIQKEVQTFELDFSPLRGYEFPDIQKLLSLAYEFKSPFRSLRSLRLGDINIKDEVVRYFLASCPHLERLSIDGSYVTKDIQFLDPLPNLKILEITNCCRISTLDLSAANLVSFAYIGDKISLPFEKIPNLSELTLGEDLADSFIFEPHKHSSYSVRLVKLALSFMYLRDGRSVIAPHDLPPLPQLCSLKRLELQVHSCVWRSLLFFTSMIKASPQLREFRIEISYETCYPAVKDRLPFPAVSASDAVKFVHDNLKMVELAGSIGCQKEKELLLQLLAIAPYLEKVVIDTKSEYYDDPWLAKHVNWNSKKKMSEEQRRDEIYGLLGSTTRSESKERAKHLISTFPQHIKFLVK